MSNAIDQIVHSVLQKENLDQCSVHELEQLTKQYPYFGTAHLLLAAKLKAKDKNAFDEYLQKTQIYFNNTFWLDQLVNNTGSAEILSKHIEEEKEISTEIENSLPPEDKIAEIQREPESISMKIDSTENSKEELSFEPYHTVDYFASQGIKFREEEKPTDRFGQQLKSFTDWLKTMKRLPQPEKSDDRSLDLERKVEQLAEHSIEDRDVITESMAEVWGKQGDKEKAIAIYEKLSLHNPSKSSYFAAKIEQLKKN